MELIFIAIGVLVGVGVILGLLIAFISSKFKVEVDKRVETAITMLPGANCGACGYPGCSGLADALVGKEVTKVKSCKVIKDDKADALVEYLNTTPGPDGTCLKVTK